MFVPGLCGAPAAGEILRLRPPARTASYLAVTLAMYCCTEICMKGMVASLAVALAVVVTVMSLSAAAASSDGAQKAGASHVAEMDGCALGI